MAKKKNWEEEEVGGFVRTKRTNQPKKGPPREGRHRQRRRRKRAPFRAAEAPDEQHGN